MLASLRLVWAERRGYLGTRFCRSTVQPNHHDMPAGGAHQTQVALWHAGGASPRKAVQDLALPVSRRCGGLSPRWRACAPDGGCCTKPSARTWAAFAVTVAE